MKIFDRNDIMLIGIKFSFLFLLSVLKLEVTFAIFQEGGKLRTSYFIIANNVIVFGVEVKIFFQYFNRNIIIMIWIEMKMMNATLKFFEHWKFSKKCFTENELLFQWIYFLFFFMILFHGNSTFLEKTALCFLLLILGYCMNTNRSFSFILPKFLSNAFRC